MDENKGPLSGKAPTEWQGPRLPAPRIYIGKKIARRRTMNPFVETYENAAVAGKRDKISRRIIRGAFARSHSRVEVGLRNARALRAQALEVARENKKSTRWGLRLLAKELAIHQPVYAPTQKQLRAMRTEARKAKRKGARYMQPINVAIDSVVDRINGGDTVMK